MVTVVAGAAFSWVFECELGLDIFLIVLVKSLSLTYVNRISGNTLNKLLATRVEYATDWEAKCDRSEDTCSVLMTMCHRISSIRNVIVTGKS